MVSQSILGGINRFALPIDFISRDYDALIEWIGDRRPVLIGKASHGTHDFYRERALIVCPHTSHLGKTCPPTHMTG